MRTFFLRRHRKRLLVLLPLLFIPMILLSSLNPTKPRFGDEGVLTHPSKTLVWSECENVIQGEKTAQTIDRLSKSRSPVRPNFSKCDSWSHVGGFHGTNNWSSTEETNFPLAYMISAYENFDRMSYLLHLIYKPHNLYCIHVDKKASQLFNAQIRQRVSMCYGSNVLLVPEGDRVSVHWGYFSVLEATLRCARLLDDNQEIAWRYMLNVNEKELPLRTNWEMVRALKAINGSNMVQANMHAHRSRIPKRNFSFPFTWIKGSMLAALRREFVAYMFTDSRAIEILNALRSESHLRKISDEMFFSTLAYNPHLGAPGACYAPVPHRSRDPSTRQLIRYVNWGDYTCHSKVWRHEICILGVGDLPRLIRSPYLFANKFLANIQPAGHECLAYYLLQKQRSEFENKRGVERCLKHPPLPRVTPPNVSLTWKVTQLAPRGGGSASQPLHLAFLYIHVGFEDTYCHCLCDFHEETYALHCETITTTLTLLGRQMHRELSSPLPLVFIYVMWGKCASLAPGLVQRLLTNFAANLAPPAGYPGRPNQSGLMWRAASSLAGGLWSVVTLGYGNRAATTTHPPPMVNDPLTNSPASTGGNDGHDINTGIVSDLSTSDSPNPTGLSMDCQILSSLSSLLVLVLATQASSILKCTNLLQELGLTSQTPSLNPYRVALFSIRNVETKKAPEGPIDGGKGGKLKAANALEPPRVSTATLLGVSSLEHDETTPFPVDFVAIRDAAAKSLHQDGSTLLLYLLIHRNPHFQTFLLENKNYNPLVLPLLNILYRSPGDRSHLVYMALIILLILTESDSFGAEIHDEDKYLHVNILAALANLSSKVTNIHPYVSDSFLCLLQLLAKRYNRTVKQLSEMSNRPNGSAIQPNAATATASTPPPSTSQSQGDSPPSPDANAVVATQPTPIISETTLIQDLSLLEEVIRMLLEILNSILSHGLASNPNLTYSLLYKRDCLRSLRTHPSFQKLPELKFKYVEEESPDEFFIPYVWSIVLRQSGIPFRTESLKLFANDAAGDVGPQQQQQSEEQQHPPSHDVSSDVLSDDADNDSNPIAVAVETSTG